MRERNYQRHILHSDNYFGEDEDLELPDNSVDKEDIETKMQVDEILSKLKNKRTLTFCRKHFHKSIFINFF